MPDSPDGRPPGSAPTIREYLNNNNITYSTWAYPDNLKGVFRVLASSRNINKKGVYDYRPLGNVHVIAANGVGGGIAVLIGDANLLFSFVFVLLESAEMEI